MGSEFQVEGTVCAKIRSKTSKARWFEEQKYWEIKDPTGLACLFCYIYAFGLYRGGTRRAGRNLERINALSS